MKYLLIDGDYMAHRMLHSPSSDKDEVTLNDEVEMYNFKIELYNSIITTYQSLANETLRKDLVDDVIIVFDNDSWRKQIPLYRPYYIDEFDITPLGYKDNRKADKEKSNINYKNFNICMRDVENMLKENKVKVINGEGAEGDDNIMLVVEELYEKNLILIFCTDGDLKYVVRGNTLLFRNIKSKVSMDGEFVISTKLYDTLYGKRDMLSLFTQSSSNTASLRDYFDKMFEVKFSTNGKEKVVRVVDVSILPTTKYINLFIKSVCGDAKDNIFPTLRWLNGTGSQFNKVTEAMIIKALKLSHPEIEYNEKSVESLFFSGDEKTNDENIVKLYTSLLKVTKQETKTTVKSAVEHYKRNLNLNQLEISNIPSYVVDNFKKNFDEVMSFPTFKSLNLRTKSKIDKFKQQSILNILG